MKLSELLICLLLVGIILFQVKSTGDTHVTQSKLDTLALLVQSSPFPAADPYSLPPQGSPSSRMQPVIQPIASAAKSPGMTPVVFETDFLAPELQEINERFDAIESKLAELERNCPGKLTTGSVSDILDLPDQSPSIAVDPLPAPPVAPVVPILNSPPVYSVQQPQTYQYSYAATYGNQGSTGSSYAASRSQPLLRSFQPVRYSAPQYVSPPVGVARRLFGRRPVASPYGATCQIVNGQMICN